MNMAFGGMPSQLFSSPEAACNQRPSCAARRWRGEWCWRTADHAQHVKERAWTGEHVVETAQGEQEKSIPNSRRKKKAEHARGPEEAHRYPPPENKEIGEKSNMSCV